jgi:MFS family permease
MSSFGIIAFFGFAPLFIQGALRKSPLEVGWAVLALSLGWSIGSLALGRAVNRWGSKASAVWGAGMLAAGSFLALAFSTSTPVAVCLTVFGIAGVGMGFVTLSTLLVVQGSLPASDLGVATASHQFSRNLGGTVGVGICGSLFTAGFAAAVEAMLAAGRLESLPAELVTEIGRDVDTLLHAETASRLPAEGLLLLQQAFADGTASVFWASTAAALACLACGLLLPPAAAVTASDRSPSGSAAPARRRARSRWRRRAHRPRPEAVRSARRPGRPRRP